ncbi:hypothetical protein BJP36_42955 [Moorena producens JHB]|uniref:Ribbon-helix-helix protein CopG domain-containing protein n=1 Tax=Moorena producens (strain JHB) TaxID=1454205 RepID=A0A9Q9UVS2_MOOP1|nr:hypothetical protein [Moorena producens]WAN69124.1 hypothetical protein BJP36_42955 [Moorena producens JHB]
MRNTQTTQGEYKIRVNLMLTPSSIKKLDKMAKRLNFSPSELVEQFAKIDTPHA